MFDKHTRRKAKLIFKWAALGFFLLFYFYLHFFQGQQARDSFALFSGALGMFVFGMNLMSSSLQRIAGNGLKSVISSLTRSPVTGMLTGIAVTVIVQSSSATTIMSVGFVNAGIMSLQQAIRIILGANIGTTITAQLIAFNLTDLAWPLLAIGSAMIVFCKTRRNKSWGEVILGFALLFIGMKFMGDALRVYREHEVFKAIFITLSQYRILGVLAGVFVTLIVQSSSATVGLTMSLASVGAFGEDPYTALMAAVPIVMGDNIGTCITAALASLGASKNAVRAALAHTMFNVCGTLILLPFLSWYCNFIMLLSEDPARQVANAHTLFNVGNGLVFLPLSAVLEKIVLFIMPVSNDESAPSIHLDKRMMSTPPIALGQAEEHLKYAMKLLSKKFGLLQELLESRGNTIDEIIETANKINSTSINRRQITSELNKFLVALARKDLTEDLFKQVTRLLYLSKDMDIVASQLDKILDALVEQGESSSVLSEAAAEDLSVCFSRSAEIFNQFSEAFDIEDAHKESIKSAIYSLTLINDAARSNHIERIKKSQHDPVESIVFLDALRSIKALLSSYVHICDHIMYRF